MQGLPRGPQRALQQRLPADLGELRPAQRESLMALDQLPEPLELRVVHGILEISLFSVCHGQSVLHMG